MTDLSSDLIVLLGVIREYEPRAGFVDEPALIQALGISRHRLRARLEDLDRRGAVIMVKPYFGPWHIRLAHPGHVALAEAAAAYEVEAPRPHVGE